MSTPHRDRLLYDPSLVSFRDPSDGYKHLAASVLIQGIHDYQNGDTVAGEWLRHEAIWWCELADFDYKNIKAVLSKK